MSSTIPIVSNDVFESDWESTRQRKLTLGLAATPAERLSWLESMIVLAWASGALPRPRTDQWWEARE